jgi:hypothetical protein
MIVITKDQIETAITGLIVIKPDQNIKKEKKPRGRKPKQSSTTNEAFKKYKR